MMTQFAIVLPALLAVATSTEAAPIDPKKGGTPPSEDLCKSLRMTTVAPSVEIRETDGGALELTVQKWDDARNVGLLVRYRDEIGVPIEVDATLKTINVEEDDGKGGKKTTKKRVWGASLPSPKKAGDSLSLELVFMMTATGEQEKTVVDAIASYMSRVALRVQSSVSSVEHQSPDWKYNPEGLAFRAHLQDVVIESRGEIPSCLLRFHDADRRPLLFHVYELFGMRHVGGEGANAVYLPTAESVDIALARLTALNLALRAAKLARPGERIITPLPDNNTRKALSEAFHSALPEASYFFALPQGHVRIDNKVLIKINAKKQKKRWDISTGIIYAPEIEDVMVPGLVRICPFYGGCLDAGEHVASGDHAWLRALSVDGGFAVSTVDTQTDARRGSRITLIGGLSYAPISLAALSGGVVAFENQQTKNWNLTWYLGVTVNLRDAIEILTELRGVEAKIAGAEKKEE